MDEEAESGVVVHRRERTVRCSPSRVRRARDDTERGKRPRKSVRAYPAPGYLSDNGPGQLQRTGRAKHVDMQSLWIQEASKSGIFVTKKVGTHVDPADLMTKPLLGPKREQLMRITGCEFVRPHLGPVRGGVVIR